MFSKSNQTLLYLGCRHLQFRNTTVQGNKQTIQCVIVNYNFIGRYAYFPIGISQCVVDLL